MAYLPEPPFPFPSILPCLFRTCNSTMSNAQTSSA
jgi:hypothetical protein